MGEFKMPALGADMEAGTLVEWKVKPGDAVRRGDVVAVVETQKGAIDVEVWERGVVTALVVPVGEKVPVGTVLALIQAEGEAPPPAPPKPVRAAPAARRLAQERGVDLATVAGTGPGGAVLAADVERAAAGAAAGAAPQAAMRQAIAAAMARSKREIPHYYLGTTIDLERAHAWLERWNAARPVTERVLMAALLLQATARALREVPELNGTWVDGRFRPSDAVHLGVAIALRQGGLVAPALHDADRKPLPDLMRDLGDLVARTRRGALRSSELADATATVTSLGEQGVETVFGVIFPPQVALVGFGAVVVRPWAADGGIAARRVVTATLSADHRASDGHRGARFLAAVDARLQRPEEP